MRHHTTAAAIVASATLLLTGCGGASNDTTAEPKPSPSTSSSTPTAPSYDFYDCKALLERNYDADEVHDASGDPECEALTRDEYVKAVTEVITGRKDEILDRASSEVLWDTAWEETDPAQQEVVCDRLAADGAVVVGQEMMEASDDVSGEEIEMAQYFLDEKC